MKRKGRAKHNQSKVIAESLQENQPVGRVTKTARHTVVFLLLVSALETALGCQGRSVPLPTVNQEERHTDMAQSLSLTEADQGGSHAASVGQDVTIRLEENPTTGYRWALDAEPAGAVQVKGSEYAPGGSAPGAAGKREFHLVPKTPGTIHLHLKLWREWQGEGSVTKRCEFVLQVGQ